MASATSSHIIHGLSCQLVVTSPQSRRCLLSSSPTAVGQAQVWSPATGAVCGQTGWWRRHSEPRSLLNLHVSYLVDSARFYPPSLTAGVPLGGFPHGEENAPLPAGARRTRPLPTPPSAAAVGVQTSWASPDCVREPRSPHLASLQTKPKAAGQEVGHTLLDSSRTSPVAAQPRLDHQAWPLPHGPPAPCASLVPACEAPDALGTQRAGGQNRAWSASVRPRFCFS